jgi:hypothetical protein
MISYTPVGFTSGAPDAGAQGYGKLQPATAGSNVTLHLAG